MITCDSNGLPNQDDYLKEEYEKEEHEVGAAIIFECLVRWSVPKSNCS